MKAELLVVQVFSTKVSTGYEAQLERGHKVVHAGLLITTDMWTHYKFCDYCDTGFPSA